MNLNNAHIELSKMINDDFCFPAVTINGKHYLRFPNIYRYIQMNNQSFKNTMSNRKGIHVFYSSDLLGKDKIKKALMPDKRTSKVSVINVKKLYFTLKNILKSSRSAFNYSRVRGLMTSLMEQYRDEIEDLSPKQLQMELNKHNSQVAKASQKVAPVPRTEYDKLVSKHHNLIAVHDSQIQDMKASKTWYHHMMADYKARMMAYQDRVAELKNQLKAKKQPWYKRVLAAAFN